MSIDTDYAVLREVLTKHKPEGWAAEFGVYTGYSLGIIREYMPVIGFDSFTGLPEDWRPGFPKGKFNDRHILKNAPAFNAMLVPGWFEDTVPGFPFPHLGLVHIDCDLYSSTVTALSGVVGRLCRDTIIVFDEFHGYPGSVDHEEKAWNEFVDKWRIKYEDLLVGEQELAVQIKGALWWD